MPANNIVYLSVDVEEYYQAEVFAGVVDRSVLRLDQPRVEKNTMEILELFREYDVRGTFFVLGTVAMKHPGLIRAIMDTGHEIASHGQDHTMVTKMSPSQFREDVRTAKRILEDIAGKPVLGYRAPTFSIVKSTDWAHGILREEGFRYSSSVYPIRHDRYGWTEFGVLPRRMAISGNEWIWEIPLSVDRIGSVNVPFGGGGYLRLYPLCLTKYLLGRSLRNGRPVTVYVHPWEIDRTHPRIALPVTKSLRHYAGISGAKEKMRGLLRSFSFQRMDRFLHTAEAAGWSPAPSA